MPHFCGHTHTKRDRRSSTLSDQSDYLGPENVLATVVASRPSLRSAGGVKSAPSHRAIAELAYSYWEKRGGQGGSALEDWLRAERELQGR